MTNENGGRDTGITVLQILRQATAALVKMDADRLDELADCCADLSGAQKEGKSTAVGHGALSEIDFNFRIFAAILSESRSNLCMLERLDVASPALSNRVPGRTGISNVQF
jgi:hypothetical protein